MILVAGGTGRLGALVVDRLARRGLDVRVLTRDADHGADLPSGVEIMAGDVRDPAATAAAAAGCAVVVSAVHGFVGPRGISPRTVDRDGNANLANAAKATGADLVLMSIVGAAADSPMELFRMKHAAERQARAVGVPTTVVRSTAFMELWIELLRRTSGRSGRPLVFGRGDNPINFVSVVDVATLVDRVVSDPATRGESLEIGGPEDLTFNQLAQAVQIADGYIGAPRHIPPAMLRVMANTIGRVKPQLGRQARAALAMDSADFTFDARPIHQRYAELPSTSVTDVLTVPTNASGT